MKRRRSGFRYLVFFLFVSNLLLDGMAVGFAQEPSLSDSPEGHQEQEVPETDDEETLPVELSSLSEEAVSVTDVGEEKPLSVEESALSNEPPFFLEPGEDEALSVDEMSLSDEALEIADTGEEKTTLVEEAPPSDEALMIPETPSGEESDVIRYTVQEGDNLWDITQSIWEDPFLWPRVWRNNIYIMNPDLIYPGNILVFPADLPEIIEEVKAQIVPPSPVKEEPVAEPPALPEPPKVAVAPLLPPPPVEPPPEPEKPKLDLSLLASSGFIIRHLDSSGKVVQTQEDRELIAENDVAYILPAKGGELAVGDQVVIYRNMRKVYHPKTRKYIGDLIRVLGTAEVTDASERIRAVRITESYDYISKEDAVLPYQFFFSNIIIPTDHALGGEKASLPMGLEAYIVDVKEGHISNAQYDIVYLDKGQQDGLRRGHFFDVIRMGRKISKKGMLPQRIIGRLEVLVVQDNTSTARIVQSNDVIRKGDIVSPSPEP